MTNYRKDVHEVKLVEDGDKPELQAVAYVTDRRYIRCKGGNMYRWNKADGRWEPVASRDPKVATVLAKDAATPEGQRQMQEAANAEGSRETLSQTPESRLKDAENRAYKVPNSASENPPAKNKTEGKLRGAAAGQKNRK